MSEPILYGTSGSPYVRSVRVALLEKAVPFQFDPFPGPQMKEAQHLSRNPLGKVPAFEHDGLIFFETQAILRYIDDAFPGMPLQPSDHRSKARMNQMVGLHDTYLFPQIAPIIFHRIRAPQLGVPVDDAAVANAIPFARKGLSVLDSLAACAPFLVGERQSLADISAAPFLELLLRTEEGREVMAPYPRLIAWLARVGRRQSMQDTRPPG